MAKSNKTKREYSKSLLIQESALIWVVTIGMMFIALVCIIRGFTGTLPWLAAMVAFPWTAYGVSQAFYYKKSTRENTQGGIKFESVMAEVNATYGQAANNAQTAIDWSVDNNVEDQSGLNLGSQPTKEIDLDYGI